MLDLRLPRVRAPTRFFAGRSFPHLRPRRRSLRGLRTLVMAPQVTATCFQEAEVAPLRVLVLPHAGGASRALALEWGKSFRSAGLNVELWGVDWTWTVEDVVVDAAARSLELVAAICTQLSSGFFGKPFVLVGHSLGALVALALTHYLEQRKFLTPRHVFFSGAAGPGSWTLYDTNVLQQDTELLKLLEQWGGTDKQLLEIPEQKQKLLAALRGDLKLHNGLVQWFTQQKEVKIRSDVTVFGGSEDTAAPAESLSKWKEVCAEGSEFEVKLFTGGHFYLTSAESQETFVKSFIAKLEMVSAIVVMESRTLIDGLNSKHGSYPSDKCLHDMFYEAAKRTPDAIAVYYEGKTLTFRQVDEQSERLADYLFHAGVRPNCISGIFMEHCIEFVIAYIAALKAGGAYMPLEIVYPPDLLERVMEESKPTIVLTKKKFRNRLPAWQQALELDDGWLESLAQQKIPVMPAARTRTHPDDLAYVSCLQEPQVSPKDLLPSPRSRSFVRLASHSLSVQARRSRGLPRLLCVGIAASNARQPTALSKLRLVWLCGEVVTLELRDRFVRLFPKCELQNLYSVSECHDVSAVDLAAMSDFDNSLSTKYASCGEVMPNVKAYRVPQPPRTDSATFPQACCTRRDRVQNGRSRTLPAERHLELIGRCDFMVKIRGYSVVLGAVESALAQHPLVSTSVVLTEGDEGEDKRLVAYIVPEDWEKVPSASNLREFLKEKLPHYAIPSVFVQLDALPINSASGKLDRKKMPSIEEAKKLRNESIDLSVDPANLPQTETEKKLASIWSELLRLENDSVLHREASFFDVGGHSLLSTRLVSSIRDTFGVHLTLADILSSPELCAIASRIDQSLGGTQDSSAKTEAEKTEKKVVLPLEAVLDASVYPAATRKAGYSRYRVEMVSLPPRNLFLTGATGFLGVHLLYALLKYSTSVVFCLVRAADEDAAMDRIRNALKEFALLDEAQKFHLEDRVIPVRATSRSRFWPYSSLKSVNVLGTQEVLRLAVTNGLAKTRVKPVHYISTNGVFPSTLAAPKFLETADLSELSDQLENGYAQSRPDAAHPEPVASSQERRVLEFVKAAMASKQLAAVEYAEWKAVCTKLQQDRRPLELQKLAAGIDSFEIYFQSDKVFDSTLSAELLQAAGISCPTINKALLATTQPSGRRLYKSSPLRPQVPAMLRLRLLQPALLGSASRRALSSSPRSFRKILVANRGEIALRVLRSAQKLNIETVAVYSDADANSQHVKLATEAYRLGPAPASESYLNYPKILEICRLSGAEAVHPGYGFLSENAAFARACQEAGVEFIGPPVKAIEDMGSKSASKDIMIKAGVPVTPGYHGADQCFETLQKEAKKIGYPVLIKAVLGGGGKGMRIVDEEKDFQDALDACVREGQASFGDGRVLIEKYLRKPRHVELQIFGDKHGNVVHLFERDCIAQEDGDAAVAAAKAVGYVGAGTVEFLLDEDESFYFMEMNTRLQVEHPVTEMITKQDLVELQLKVAAGQKLPIRQEDLKIHGHAIEARIYAENPYNDFLPGSGTLEHLRLPRTSKDVRVDTGIIEGDEVSIFYDPMIAKLIVHADNRQAALDKMIQALHEYQIVGLPTNIEFVARTVDHAAFRKGGVDTSFLNQFGNEVLGSLGPTRLTLRHWEPLSPWSDDSLAHFRSLETLERKLSLSHDDDEASVSVKCLSKDTYEVILDGDAGQQTHVVSGAIDESGDFKFRVGNRTFKGTAVIRQQDLHLFCDDNSQRYDYKFHVPLPSFEPAEGSAGAAAHSKIVAPMPGKIIKVLVKNVTRLQPINHC
ncbi:Alpha/Beta hydrolase fold [Phytophthora cactorum]|nr:Alpha/Beta hydrolase fold [Phytophthora cactorum]